MFPQNFSRLQNSQNISEKLIWGQKKKNIPKNSSSFVSDGGYEIDNFWHMAYALELGKNPFLTKAITGFQATETGTSSERQISLCR